MNMVELSRRIYSEALCRLFTDHVVFGTTPQLMGDMDDCTRRQLVDKVLARADELAIVVTQMFQHRNGTDAEDSPVVEGWAHVEVMGKQAFFGWTRDLRETGARMLEVKTIARDGSPGDVKRFGAGAIFCCTFLMGDDPEGDCKHLAAGEFKRTCDKCKREYWSRGSWTCPDCEKTDHTGFEPGEVHGPQKCPAGACSDCDGEHHWIEVCTDVNDSHGVYRAEEVPGVKSRTGIPADADAYDNHPAVLAGLETFYVCKHCDAWAEMVEVEPDEEDDDDGPDSVDDF